MLPARTTRDDVIADIQKHDDHAGDLFQHARHLLENHPSEGVRILEIYGQEGVPLAYTYIADYYRKQNDAENASHYDQLANQTAPFNAPEKEASPGIERMIPITHVTIFVPDESRRP